MGLPAFDPNQPYTEEQDALPAFDPSAPYEEEQTKTTTTKQPTVPPVAVVTKPVKQQKTPVQQAPVRTAGIQRSALEPNQPEQQAVTDEQAKLNDQFQQDIIFEARHGKGTKAERVQRLVSRYPQLKGQEADIAYGIDYYRGGNNGSIQFYMTEDQANTPLVVQGTKTPANQSHGVVLDTLQDVSSGVGEGFDNFNNQAMKLLAKGSDAIGLTDNSVSDMEDLIRVANNKRELTFVNPDGYARPVGEFIGENAVMLPLAEVAPFTKLFPTGGALAAGGDLAVQGGIAGVIGSGGDNMADSAAKSAFLTALFAGLPFHPNPSKTDVEFFPARETPEGLSAADFEITTPEGSAKGTAYSDGKVEFSEPLDAGLRRTLGEPEPAATETGPIPDEGSDVVGRLTSALQQAGKASEDQILLRKKERADRFARVREAQQQSAGKDAYINSLSALKGELPKAEFEPVEGSFSQSDINELFQVITDTPTLTTTGKISGYSGLEKLLKGELPAPKELEHLAEAFPKDLVKALVSKRTITKKLVGGFEDVWNLPKSLMASADLSAPLRQGLGLIHRQEWRDASRKMISYAKSQKNFDDLTHQIKTDPDYSLAEEAGLSLTTADAAVGELEDMFRSHLAEKLPVAGAIVRGSERGYVGFLNKLRFDTFKTLIKQAEESGIDIREDVKSSKAVANYINIMTGRGGLGRLEPIVRELNLGLFSPRLISSRLQILTAPLVTPIGKGFIADLPAGMRKEAAKSYAGMMGYYSTLVGLAVVAGYEVSANPLSSDFGKIKHGNTRVDLAGGLLQYITAGARALMRESTSVSSGSTRKLEKQGDTPLDSDLRFIFNKLHPSFSLLVDQQRGTDAVGNKFKWKDALIARMTPMGIPDIVETIKEHPNSDGILYSTLGLLGAGLQNFPSKESKTDLPAFDSTKPFAEDSDNKQKDKETEEALPSFDETKPFSLTTEPNLLATSVVEKMGLHITDNGLRSEQKQAEYYRTTKGAAPPGHSDHGNGNAIDIRVPKDGTKPEDIKRNLEAAGFKNVHYITRPHGTGPHWHFAWTGQE